MDPFMKTPREGAPEAELEKEETESNPSTVKTKPDTSTDDAMSE